MPDAPANEINAVLTETAAYVNAVGPQLEKLASVEAVLGATAASLPSKLAAHGVIAPADVKRLQAELASPTGGVTKLAEIVDVLLTKAARAQLGAPASKQAALGPVGAPKPRTADEIWDSAFSRR